MRYDFVKLRHVYEFFWSFCIMLFHWRGCSVLRRQAWFSNRLSKKNDYFIILLIFNKRTTQKTEKNNRTVSRRESVIASYNKISQPNHNTRSRTRPSARTPGNKRNQLLSSMPQHVVYRGTCATPGEWRWTWQWIYNEGRSMFRNWVAHKKEMGRKTYRTVQPRLRLF